MVAGRRMGNGVQCFCSARFEHTHTHIHTHINCAGPQRILIVLQNLEKYLSFVCSTFVIVYQQNKKKTLSYSTTTTTEKMVCIFFHFVQHCFFFFVSLFRMSFFCLVYSCVGILDVQKIYYSAPSSLNIVLKFIALSGIYI